jgi:flagellar basal body-associated protein FliL
MKVADGNESGMSLLQMVGLVLLIIVIAAGTSYGVMRFFNSEPAKTQETSDKVGPTYSLGNFTANLAGSGGYQFIKASIVVEVDDDKVISELEKRSPQIRDQIITILRESNLEAVREPGANIIKHLMINNLNNILNKGQITNVWFTKLVVQ